LIVVDTNIIAYTLITGNKTALALSLDVRCVTEDKRLVKAFPQTALSMEAFCA